MKSKSIFRLNIVFLAFLLLPISVVAQKNGDSTSSVLVTLVNGANAVFEGKVLSSKGFYGPENRLIYTALEVEVYKVFKGEFEAPIVEVIKEGGSVGNRAMSLSHGALGADNGSIGIFFVNPTAITNSGSPIPNNLKFDPYLGSDGFLWYIPHRKEAYSLSHKFTDISGDLYSQIQAITKQSFRSIKHFDIKEWDTFKDRREAAEKEALDKNKLKQKKKLRKKK